MASYKPLETRYKYYILVQLCDIVNNTIICENLVYLRPTTKITRVFNSVVNIANETHNDFKIMKTFVSGKGNNWISRNTYNTNDDCFVWNTTMRTLGLVGPNKYIKLVFYK
jgi:hypothetical protein